MSENVFSDLGMNEFAYDTRDVEDWNQIWLATRRISHFMFTAMACSDVKILIGAIMFSTDPLNTYVITIEANGNQTMIEWVPS